MIVTRRRKRPFPWKRVLIPLVPVALIAAVLVWPPTRSWIAAQAPVQSALKPFDPIAQQQTIREQQSQIASLQQQLSDARSQLADSDQRISRLRSQVSNMEEQAAIASVSARVRPAARSAALVQPANDLAEQGTPDMRRTAQVWGAMDPEAAAKVVQRLPIAYVARIFALMTPDAVGAILENVPSSYAALLTQERPELKR